jgi:hypothetical protein
MVADQIVALLNEMLSTDAAATESLIASRVRCNIALASHPTIQVGISAGFGFNATYNVGLLGVLNGLAGVDRRVVAVMDDTGRIVEFEARDFPREG